MWKWKTCHFFADVLALIACLLKYARNPPLCWCDCIPHGSLMAHEELCSPSERIICHRTGTHRDGKFNPLAVVHLSTSFSIHSAHAVNIRGQINWLPAAEDTYLPASQLCTGDPNTKTRKRFITLMLNSKRIKRERPLQQHQITAIPNATKRHRTSTERHTMIKTSRQKCVH